MVSYLLPRSRDAEQVPGCRVSSLPVLAREEADIGGATYVKGKLQIKSIVMMTRRVTTTKIVTCIHLEEAPERESVLRDSRCQNS